MNINESLQWATTELRRADIDSAPLDAEILLSFVLKKPREFIFSCPEKNIRTKELRNIRTFIGRRKRGEPIAYIVGEKEFYGLKFRVNKDVLIPRPETELIVDLVLKKLTTTDHQPTTALIDIGTGSGCIPIAIAKCLKNKKSTIYRTRPCFINSKESEIKIFAADISKNVLKIARQNAKLNGVSQKITFLQGNLLEPFIETYKLLNLKTCKLRVTANLPYVPTSEWRKLPPNIKNHEPRAALDGGADGLKYYRKLFKQLKSICHSERSEESRGGSEVTTRAVCGSLTLPRDSSVAPLPQNDNPEQRFWTTLFLEMGLRQKDALKKIILKHFPNAKIQFHKDLAGKWRAAEIKL